MNYETMFLKGGKDSPEPKKSGREAKEDKKRGKKAQKDFEDENDQYPISDNQML